MQTTQLQTGIAVAQTTQGDVDFYVPDGALPIQKLSPQAILALTNYDAIVGPTLSPVVLYTTIASAVAAVPAGGTILVLKGTYPEASITLSTEVHIVGQWRSTIISNPVILAAGAALSSIFGLKFGSNLTVNASCNSCFITHCWQAPTFTITNNGANNEIVVIQE